MSDQPGFKKLKVPSKDQLRPNMRDCTPEKGALEYVKPAQMVHDLGAPRDALTPWRGVPSPASPTFKAGVPMGVNPSPKPEQETLPIQTGRTWMTRHKKTNPES